MALRIAKDPRFERLICTHSGTYADDCLCERVRQHRCYVVATCDKDLRRRLRKVSALAYPHLSRASSRVESWHEIFSPSLSSCQFALFRIVCSVQWAFWRHATFHSISLMKNHIQLIIPKDILVFCSTAEIIVIFSEIYKINNATVTRTHSLCTLASHTY